MRKFKFLRSKSYRCFLLPNGKLVDVYSCRYDAKVNLHDLTFLSCADDGYKESNLPTFNDLVQNGVVKEVSCIERTYDIDFPSNVRSLTKKMIKDIIKEFSDNGFHVSERAIRHNYYCWKYDMKSGYRGKNYHLFTPCGCNPLSFRATTLHRKCADWQKTYNW